MNALWDFRKQIYHNGFRPVSIRSSPVLMKRPTLFGWTEFARCDPPYPAVSNSPHASFQSTGILTDGLQAIDIDIDDPTQCLAVATWCFDHLGPAPVRYRRNTCRLALLYRAAEGSPPKAKAWKPGAKPGEGQGTEILGHGNQLHAFGYHPTGAELQWMDDKGPHNVMHHDLIAISLPQVQTLLDYTRSLLGVQQTVITHTTALPSIPPANYIGTTLQWHEVDIIDTLQAIPNCWVDYDWWLRICMATFVASHGTGYDLFLAWSALNTAHDERMCKTTWAALSRNPPTRITGSTLLRYAREANGGSYIKPSRRLVILPFHKEKS